MVWTAARDITRVSYNLNAWDRAPRQLRIQGRTVRLGGFSTSDPLTVRLIDAWSRERIDILVIAPSTDPAVAQRALMLASVSDDSYRAGEIMAHAQDPS